MRRQRNAEQARTYHLFAFSLHKCCILILMLKQGMGIYHE